VPKTKYNRLSAWGRPLYQIALAPAIRLRLPPKSITEVDLHFDAVSAVIKIRLPPLEADTAAEAAGFA